MAENYKPHSGGLSGKIFLAFLLGVGAIVVALAITYLGLNKMLVVIDDLAEPNIQLNALNNLYRQVTKLEHQQRMESILNPGKPSKDFLSESSSILASLDSLERMPWKDPKQRKRIQQMQQIIRHRDNLFLRYLELKSTSAKNKKFANQLDTLSIILHKSQAVVDTSIRTTQQKKTIVTTWHDSALQTPPEPRRSFFSRLFKKKSPSPVVQQPKQKITEEINVTVDTLAIAQRNNKINEVQKMIQELEQSELSRRVKLAGRELELIKITDDLLSQMIEVLHQVEVEEIASVRASNEAAIQVFNKSIFNIMLILLFFSLLAATLVYLILIDISKSNYYREQLVLAKNKAEELALVKDRFLANISHEIRTPLQSIIGFSEQVMMSRDDSAAQSIKAINSSSQHLLHIVNEVLDYSRLESGKFILESRNFYLLEIVEDVTTAMRVQAEKKGLHFSLETEAAQNEFVSGDPFRLQQILYNLLGNAVKFTPAGSVKLIVSSAMDSSYLACTFNVHDTGIGIRAEEKEKIFHRFEQANPAISSEFGGTGLGLSIVKKLVDVHGGSLEVYSEPGKGSLFQVKLKFKIAKNGIPKPDTLEQADAHHVLIIDDDPLVLELCKLILQKERLKLTTCHTPEKLFEQSVPDGVTHILMDIRMGSINGFDLCDYLRTKIKQDVKIIAMSAHLPESESLSCFDAILRKPFREDDLLHVVLGKQSERTEAAENKFELVRKMTLGDEVLFQSILSDFIHETRVDVQKLNVALARSDTKQVLNLVHRLSGRAGQMGFTFISQDLNNIESQIEQGNTLEKMQNLLVQTLEELKHQIEEARSILQT